MLSAKLDIKTNALEEMLRGTGLLSNWGVREEGLGNLLRPLHFLRWLGHRRAKVGREVRMGTKHESESTDPEEPQMST